MLDIDNTIISNNGMAVRIMSLIADDYCRYQIYEIEYNSDLCELRIYYSSYRTENFKKDMIERTLYRPNNFSLLWPLDYIDDGNMFGVITNRCPQNTIPVYDIFYGKNEFRSFTSMVNSGISICSIFKSIAFTFPSVCDCYDFHVNIESGDAILINFEYLITIHSCNQYAWNARNSAPSLVRGE